MKIGLVGLFVIFLAGTMNCFGWGTTIAQGGTFLFGALIALLSLLD